MHYELPLVKELCDEVGLKASFRGENEVVIELDKGVFLCFKNIDKDDCLIGFDDTPWHTHDNAQFYGGRGYCIDVSYLDLITGISQGKILVCESSENGKLKDRYLIHSEYNDEFKHMQRNEQFLVKIFPLAELVREFVT